MKRSKVKLLLLVCLLTGLGAVLAALAAGSHIQIGFNDGAFHFDFKLATGESAAATVLGLIALATGLAGAGLYLSGDARGGDTAASTPGPAGVSEFSDFPNKLRQLTKSKRDVWVGGVCGGLGEHTPLPSWVWRLAFLLLLCCYGSGVLLYVLLWICLPEPRAEAPGPGTVPGATADAAK